VYLQCDPFPIALTLNEHHADSTTVHRHGYQNDTRNDARYLIWTRHNVSTGVLTCIAGGPEPTLENQTKTQFGCFHFRSAHGNPLQAYTGNVRTPMIVERGGKVNGMAQTSS